MDGLNNGQVKANSSIMAELYVVTTQPINQGEVEQGLTPPGDLGNVDGQMPEAPETSGFLMAEGGKYYGMAENFLFPTLKFSELLPDIPLTKEAPKFSDKRENQNPLTFKEKLSERDFKLLETKKNQGTQEKLLDPKKETVNKTHAVAQKVLSATKEASKPILAQPPLKMSKEEMQTHFQKRTERKEERSDTPQRSEAKAREEKENPVPLLHQRESVQRKQEQEERKKDQEREGFSEDQKKKKDQEFERETIKKRVTAKKAIEEKIIQYGSGDSDGISQVLQRRVSQFDVLLLFLELLKLAIKSRELERESRWQERELQIYHMQKVVENFKTQGRNLLMAGIGSGVMGIVSGLCPIVGHLKGDWIKDKLGLIPFLDKFRSMETAKLFKGLEKMTFQMSQVQKTWGEVQHTMAEGSRTHDQHLSDLHKTDGDEDTRTMEEIKDFWKNIENFLYQVMQMYHDVIRQLYGI